MDQDEVDKLYEEIDEYSTIEEDIRTYQSYMDRLIKRSLPGWMDDFMRAIPPNTYHFESPDGTETVSIDETKFREVQKEHREDRQHYNYSVFLLGQYRTCLDELKDLLDAADLHYERKVPFDSIIFMAAVCKQLLVLSDWAISKEVEDGKDYHDPAIYYKERRDTAFRSFSSQIYHHSSSEPDITIENLGADNGLLTFPTEQQVEEYQGLRWIISEKAEPMLRDWKDAVLTYNRKTGNDLKFFDQETLIRSVSYFRKDEHGLIPVLETDRKKIKTTVTHALYRTKCS